MAGDAFESIAQSFGHAAQDATSWLWEQLGPATAVSLGGAGFSTVLGMVAAIAATVAVGLFVLQVIQSALRRDPGGLARAVKGPVRRVHRRRRRGRGREPAARRHRRALQRGGPERGRHRPCRARPAGARLDGHRHPGRHGQRSRAAAAGVLLLSLAILAAVVIVYVALSSARC